MPTPTFWVEQTGQVRRWLRRFGGPCPSGENAFHQSMVRLDDVVAEVGEIDGRHVLVNNVDPAQIPFDDPRWDAPCAACGQTFVDDPDDDDPRSIFIMELYTRPGSRDAWINRAVGSSPEGADPLPPGAMFDAWWSPRRGPDGISLTVILPNGHGWHVDHRASNCGSPDDDVHYCWVRHGDPRTEPVTVDKAGVTCNAGAGSIGVDGYHGFLQQGSLTDNG